MKSLKENPIITPSTPTIPPIMSSGKLPSLANNNLESPTNNINK